MDELKTYTGAISNYIYESSESMYKVCTLLLENMDEITIVGSFPRLEEGLQYEFTGVFKDNPKYGRQLYVESYAKSKSFSKEGLVLYLSSDKFYGIGAKLAERIVDTLGLDCIDKILADNSVLDQIPSLTKPKKEALVQALILNTETERVYIKLFDYGLTAKMVEKLFEHYGVKAPHIIEANPYILIKEVDGFGFKRCDKLALDLGIGKTDPKRINAALQYSINFICNSYGYTFIYRNQLLSAVFKLLADEELDMALIEKLLDLMISSGELITEDDRIYDHTLYHCEERIAEKLIKIKNGTFKAPDKKKILNVISKLQDNLEIEYTDNQVDAIMKSLSSKLSIITGGPGTGKSTILKGILYGYAELNGMAIGDLELSQTAYLASPTGRAAKRMSESTGYKATTIHKMLGYNRDGMFNYNDQTLLPAKLLIVDEVSMLDTYLADHLLKALANNVQIVFVGDSNQLPSVGPGNILYDLIASDLFQVTVLNQIMRQAQDSDIVNLSSMILSERVNFGIFNKKKEAYFYPCESSGLIELVFKILDNFISKGGSYKDGIQILAPMYAGPAGIDEINKAIQARYNTEDKLITRDGKTFKKGDKVLQLKNDSELDIMNGDLGEILDIVKEDEKDVFKIRFDDRILTYPTSNVDSLALAYAMSVHKSQGSEFENVIMPILPSYAIMLKKKIIYTGITRAKKKIILVGNTESLKLGISKRDSERQTTLNYRIRIKQNKPNKIYINDPEIPFETLGEYDMEGITPYTFMEN